MLLKQLKEMTRHDHEQIGLVVDIPSRVASLDSYRMLLARFYGFYAPLEETLAHVADLTAVVDDLEARYKLALLARDLLALGLSHDELIKLPRCQALPPLPNVAAALGCLYVTEGSTLGGQILVRQLQGALQLGPEHGLAFFYAYGPTTGSMWRRFGAQLEAYATTPEREAEVVAGTKATYRTMQEWIVNG
ncbi:biliverdin-producing heme oxygenase [Candidatus Viridilinea mediisalina]|nr:biliverdin-producing heme oxygenase [Candidatus Viridilinea mediisalina]